MSVYKATIPLPHLTIEVEAETQKELFQQVASIMEVFGEKSCGCCNTEDIRPFWRVVTKGKQVFEYPEYVCQDPNCRAKLTLGLNLVGGGMFPNRKLLPNGQPATGKNREQGRYGPTRGWTKYRGHDNDESDISQDADSQGEGGQDEIPARAPVTRPQTPARPGGRR